MGVQKFRSAEVMNATPPRERTGSEFDRFVRHCSRYSKISRRVFPRGVFKFRSIEEAQKARARVTKSQISDG